MNFKQKVVLGIRYSLIATLICCMICALYMLMYKKGKRLKVGDVVITLLIVLISSLRYDVGTDYDRYLRSAANVTRLFSNFRSLYSLDIIREWSYEIGFETIALITNKVSDSPYAIFWFFSIIIYVPLMWYFRKKTSNAFIAFSFFILFGFWGMSLNIIKQFTAMVMILFFYEAMKEKKNIACILIGLIAISFHTTALLVELFVLLANKKILSKILKPTRGTLLWVVIVGIILRLSTGWIVRLLSFGKVFAKYIRYVNSDSLSRTFIMIDALIEAILIFSLIYIAISRIDSLRVKNAQIDSIIALLMVGLLFSIVGISRTMWVSKRFADYFYMFFLTVVPDLLGGDKNYVSNKHTVLVEKKNVLFWMIMVLWHLCYAVLSLDNHSFVIQTYLFK